MIILVNPDFIKGFDKRFKKDVDLKEIKTFSQLSKRFEAWENENRKNLKYRMHITKNQQRALAERVKAENLDIKIKSKPDKDKKSYDVSIFEIQYKAKDLKMTVWRDEKGRFRKSPI